VFNKDQAVLELSVNCGCWKGKAEQLKALDDATLNQLHEDAVRMQLMEAVVNAVAARDDVPEGVTVADMPEIVANLAAPKTKFGTIDEWVAAAPAEALPVWNSVSELYKQQKAEAIKKLVGNATGKHRDLLVKSYLAAPLDDLLEAAGTTNNSTPPTTRAKKGIDDGIEGMLNFGGASGGVPTGNSGVFGGGDEFGDGVDGGLVPPSYVPTEPTANGGKPHNRFSNGNGTGN
jgi:hypothetical protein